MTKRDRAYRRNQKQRVITKRKKLVKNVYSSWNSVSGNMFKHYVFKANGFEHHQVGLGCSAGKKCTICHPPKMRKKLKSRAIRDSIENS